MMSGWTPLSWKACNALQQPRYPNADQLAASLAQIRAFPSLVDVGEVLTLKKHLASAAAGQSFVLHGGDCAERFVDCNPESIAAKLEIILELGERLSKSLGKPIVRIGRIAGQYAKPRSDDTERVGAVTLPSYRGDIINGFSFCENERVPNPNRLVQAYVCACFTLNHLRALLQGGARVEFYASHEALLLDYESALTSFVPWENSWFNLGTHFLWLGERTRQLQGAHVEYLRGVANPIGIKVGPSIDPTELVTLVKTLNPKNDLGRMTLITRMGANLVWERLPTLVNAICDAGLEVVWSCDPMHGNMTRTAHGLKTRHLETIAREITQTFAVHDKLGSWLGGVHLELTGDDVTECVGGRQNLAEEHLLRNYQTYCDPRLNRDQSLEIVENIGALFR